MKKRDEFQLVDCQNKNEKQLSRNSKIDIADAGKIVDKAEMKKPDKSEKRSQDRDETDSFHKLCNKEIKVN